MIRNLTLIISRIFHLCWGKLQDPDVGIGIVDRTEPDTKIIKPFGAVIVALGPLLYRIYYCNVML